MPDERIRFDDYLDAVSSSKLKSMARIWGGGSATRKDEHRALICRGLGNRKTIESVIAVLTPHERNALALAKQFEGVIESGVLAVGLRALGIPLPQSKSDHSSESTILIQPLVQRGLFLTNYAYDPGYFYDSSEESIVFTDERLLAAVPGLEYQPLTIQPLTQHPLASTYRRPPAVVLDFISILQTIDNLGGLLLTKSGTVRANELRKLAKAMKWKDDQLSVDGLSLRDPTIAFTYAFYYADWLSLHNQSFVLAESLEQLATRPYTEQVSRLLWGFVENHQWHETQLSSSYYQERLVQARLALVLALMALPVDTQDFFAVDDLDQALYDRIGDYFALSFSSWSRGHYFSKSPEEIKKAEAARLEKRRQEWLGRERKWLTQALSSWLYFLGIVELGMEGGTPVSVRLTQLGRAVLHPQLSPSVDAPTASQPAWIVQPNFEVMVYLEYTAPEQLTFLERIGERVQAQQHTALYRLTRESIYQALENGTSLEELLTRLQTGASVAVPQNVQVDIRSWGGLREEITLRRQSQLMEFPDATSRQNALSQGVEGVPLGERFLLLIPIQEVPKRFLKERIDYAQALPKCLSVNEEGVIQLLSSADLMLPAQLDQWAERISEDSWGLTQQKVKAAVKLGAKIDHFYQLMESRLIHPLPALLKVALRAWAGIPPSVAIAQVTVLRCLDKEVFEAIAKSKKLKPYLLGQLAPDVLLVNTQKVEALRKQLEWVGLQVADELVITKKKTE